MALPNLLALIVASALAQSPPAAPPPTTAPTATQPAAPLLSGPTATETDADKLTLVHRTFDGKVESVGAQPDAVAIRMLDLTPEQRAKYDEINAARLTIFDDIIRSNYGLVLDLASLQGQNDPAHRNEVLAHTTEAFKRYTDRGTFYQEMWPFLTDDQRQKAQAMVVEYREARAESLRLEMGPGVTPRSLGTREKLEGFGQMVRESIERQVGLERDEFEAFANELELTSEQRNAAEAIFQPLAIKRFQKIPVSSAEQSAAFAEFNKLLTAGQKQKVYSILLKRYQQQDAGHAATRPATQPAAPTATPPAKPATNSQPQAYKLDAGPFGVSERLLTLTDAARNRDVPVKVYMPKEIKEPKPVIVLSPGWGGSRDGYAYLARHWASYGYFCIVLEHDGSDLDFAKAAAAGGGEGAVLRVANALRTSVNDPANWINRAQDVTFTLDELNRRNGLTGDEFFGKLDLSRVGMSGHSFGAYTTLLIMGATVDVPSQQHRGFRDSRCIAGIAMSSQGDTHIGLTADSWNNMAAPMLYMCGTKDYEIGTRDASGRRVAFDRTPADKADDQTLVTIKDAEHMAFSDNTRGIGGENIERNPAHHQWILMTTTAFWDAHLRNDGTARAWLQSDALKTISNGDCAVERK